MIDPTTTQISTKLRILYPLWMLIGMFSLIYVPSQIFTVDQALETAESIKSNELLFRVGIAGRLITQLLGVIIPVLLYFLFKPYNKNAAFLMLLLILISVPICMFTESHNLLALTLLDSPEQMMNHLDISGLGLNIASIFWGLWLFPLGYLAYKSGFFPKIIGYCLFVAGLGYFMGAFLKILFPEATMIYSITEILTIGEVVFILWFIIRGVKSIAPNTELLNDGK